jgi:hypothetical protein
MIRNDVEVVETTRQRLGPVGVCLAAAQAAIDHERQAARRIEELGYGSIWTPEVPVRPASDRRGGRPG